jgi:predicted N-formylglutamate amidohydrolase
LEQLPDVGAGDPQSGSRLIDVQELDPVLTVNEHGGSPFLLTGDHAGNLIPHRLGTLGLSTEERLRHIAWDIGVLDLGERLSVRLDAAFIAQRYSRLVIDCNRDPLSADAIPTSSDGTVIPGNEGLSEVARAARVADIHTPYQARIAEQITARAQAGRQTILVALHSFTPCMAGAIRPWEVGILYWRGRTGFARALIAGLRGDGRFLVGDNEPYRMDETDHSVPRHAFGTNLPYAEIEVRQDLIADRAGQEAWSRILAEQLQGAAQAIDM